MSLIRNKTFLKFCKYIISIVLVFYIFKIVDWKNFLQTLQDFNYLYLIPITSLYFFGIALSSIRWKNILNQLGYNNINFHELYKHYLVGSLYNNILPSSIGGDFIKFSRLTNKVNKLDLGKSILMDRTWGLLTSIFVSFITFGFLLLNNNLTIFTNHILSLIQLSFGLIIIFTTLTFFTHKKIIVFCNYLKLKVNNKLFTKFINFFIKIILLLPQTYKGAMPSVLFNFNSFIGNFLIFYAINYNINFLYILTINPIISFISFLPISINSIGIKESSSVFFYGIFGISSYITIAFSLISRVLIMIYNLAGIFFI